MNELIKATSRKIFFHNTDRGGPLPGAASGRPGRGEEGPGGRGHRDRDPWGRGIRGPGPAGRGADRSRGAARARLRGGLRRRGGVPLDGGPVAGCGPPLRESAASGAGGRERRPGVREVRDHECGEPRRVASFDRRDHALVLGLGPASAAERACPGPRPSPGCVGSRRAGTGTIKSWRRQQRHQHSHRHARRDDGAATTRQAAPADLATHPSVPHPRTLQKDTGGIYLGFV